MSKRAFDKIAEGLQESIAIARGERQAAKFHIPAEISVKAIRQRLKLSQEDFAYEYGFSVNQIKDWEQGRTRPLGALRLYLLMISHDPDGVLKMIREAGVREEAA
ncbi:helix-turn-helix domain-containing protein [Methylorubrum extorquens]|uniref:Helix-turn-helix domain protein n=1 Tax=Methylorubrum extorquens DSM 13060 TaxID=882800 RepID=H1KC81_METEX|nr:helix-turn-helix domain-containing protein [Methylorubrum extorquens]EHP94898.1 helix-turn-helix domain protein [Methylorubrum extorquens DSM 13060]